MKLSDFEKCIVAMGLELISVSLSAKSGEGVNHALAVKRMGKKCEAFHWWFGCCRKSMKIMSYGDVKENHCMYESRAPLQWSPFPSLNIAQLEKKYFEKCAKSM